MQKNLWFQLSRATACEVNGAPDPCSEKKQHLYNIHIQEMGHGFGKDHESQSESTKCLLGSAFSRLWWRQKSEEQSVPLCSKVLWLVGSRGTPFYTMAVFNNSCWSKPDYAYNIGFRFIQWFLSIVPRLAGSCKRHCAGCADRRWVAEATERRGSWEREVAQIKEAAERRGASAKRSPSEEVA